MIPNTCLSAGVRPWSPCRILICFTTVDFPLPPFNEENWCSSEFLGSRGSFGFAGWYQLKGSLWDLEGSTAELCQDTSPQEVSIFLTRSPGGGGLWLPAYGPFGRPWLQVLFFGTQLVSLMQTWHYHHLLTCSYIRLGSAVDRWVSIHAHTLDGCLNF